jgi:siderophore synthetase component
VTSAEPEARGLVLERLALAVAREGLAPEARWADGKLTARLGDRELHARFEGPLGFGRYRTLVQCSFEDPLDLLEALRPTLVARFPSAQVDRLGEELASSVAHLTLGLEARRRRLHEAADARLLDWWQGFPSADARRRALEGLLVTGHSVHPCTKTRIGMTLEEAARYAPEVATSAVEGWLVPVRRDLIVTAGEDPERLWAEAWPGACAGLDSVSYTVMPVHPWQLAHVLPELAARLPPGGLRLDLAAPAPFWPQASLRTIEPASGRSPVHAKLALHVHTTSAERTVSPQSVVNGPRVSSMLVELTTAHRIPVRIVRERGAVGLSPAQVAGGDMWARQLAAIARDNPSSLDAAGAAWPDMLAAAWCSPSPVGEGSLLAGWVGFPGAFMEAFARHVVRPLAELVARFGVGLEAHGQNLLLDLDANGLPCGSAIRDFGGIRIYRPRLREAGFDLALAPDSAIDAESMDDVLAKFSHTTLQSLTCDLLGALVEVAPDVVPAAWDAVRRALEEAWSAPGTRPAELGWFCGPTARLKCLTTMRLEDRFRHYTFRPTSNPLWRAP